MRISLLLRTVPFFGWLSSAAILFFFTLSYSPLLYGAENPSIIIQVDGKTLPMGKDKIFTIPYGSRQMNLTVNGPNFNSPDAKWLRYQLQGYDPDWIYRRGEMRIGLSFYDAKGSFINQSSVTARGRSPGWNQNIGDSTFTHRREPIQIPPEGKRIQAFISSAGAPSVVGIYLATGIHVLKISKEGASTIVDSSGFLSQQGEAPYTWVRDGYRPDMAKLYNIGKGPFAERAFCLFDESPLGHAEWHQSGTVAINTKPGDQVVMEWNEMFNTGDANKYFITYTALPPGKYLFRVEELDTMGHPTGREQAITIVVPLPLWKNPWAWAISASIAAILLFFLIRYMVQAKIRRHIERLQQENLLEQERMRIARDIHDDLGARLTQISLVSGMAEDSAETENDHTKFKEISVLSRELVSSMYETVWTVDPQNDHLESLVSFLCQSTEKLCKPIGIRCRIKADPILDNRQVRSEIRHNVILSVKESVHNAIKHSGASEIGLGIAFNHRKLELTISDDGRGFDTDYYKNGYGIKNLEKRMKTIGGTVEMESSMHSGTRIRFSIPIP